MKTDRRGMTLGEGFFLRGKTFFEIHNYHPDWKTTLQKIEIQKKIERHAPLSPNLRQIVNYSGITPPKRQYRDISIRGMIIFHARLS